MKTILLVEDDLDILELIKYNLEKEGYATCTARNGKQGIELARTNPDLIILDVMMAELDGLEVIKQLKKHPSTEFIPVIFLTAKGSEFDEVLGLELGADDYIVKPVSMLKLIARIKKVLGRYDHPAEGSNTNAPLRIGALSIDEAKHTVLIDTKEIFFPRKEFALLLYLARHLGEVVQRDILLPRIWGTEVVVGDRTIDVHIRKIREKLGIYAEMIETIKGVGYKLRELP